MDFEEMETEEGPSTRRRSARIRGGPTSLSESETSPKKGRGRRGRAAKRASESEDKIVEEAENNEPEADCENQDMPSFAFETNDGSMDASETPQNGMTACEEAQFEYSLNSTKEISDITEGAQESASSDVQEGMADAYNEYSTSDAEPNLVNENSESEANCSNSVMMASETNEDNSNSNDLVNNEMDESNASAGAQQSMDDNTEAEDSGSKRKLDELDDGQEEAKSALVESGPTPPKKAHLDINVRKLLPELEKHWKAVEDEPTDFTAWTYLLQYVDQENELLAAREAYDKFLARYPYCYGYWKKYADYEKRKGSAEDCEKVFQRGLKAISLSVDLWIHYLNYVKAAYENNPDYIRSQYNAAIDTCGMEFRSDKLWEHYVQWERDNNNLKNVLAVYDRLISMPTLSYQGHFQNLKDFINLNNPSEILSAEEYEELKSALSQSSENDSDEDETSRIRTLILEKRTAIHKANEAEITARWSFEDAIKRPYFHVKPLEKGQLKMWKDYLDFEIEKGNTARISILFERCLIACALYEEYWIRYTKYLQTRPERDVAKIREIYRRACVVHHPTKPWINLHWAAFEESEGDFNKAEEILEKLHEAIPDSVHVITRRINLARRRKNNIKVVQLFDQFIEANKDKEISAHITIKYARYLWKVLGDYDKATSVLQAAIDAHEGTRAKVIMALVDMGMEQKPVDVSFIISTFDKALKSEISDEQKVTFAHRKIEFLEDFGDSIQAVEEAHEELQALAKSLREKKAADPNKQQLQPGTDDPSKTAAQNGAYNNSQYSQQQQGPYGQQYNQYGNYSNWNYQQPSSYGAYNQGQGQGQQGWSAYQGYYGGTDPSLSGMEA